MNMHDVGYEPDNRIANAAYGFDEAAQSAHIRREFGSIQEIKFPEAGILRARKVVSRSNARSTGKYPSWKMGRMMHYESTLELNAFRLLDVDPRVIRFGEQPCKIVYLRDGVTTPHFPDVLVEYADRKEFWEIKSDQDAIDAEVIARTALMQDLGRFGYGYRLVVAADLSRQPRLENARRLHDFGAVRRVCHLEREAVRLALRKVGYITWKQGLDRAFGVSSRQILCRLVLEGSLRLDLDAPWTQETHFIQGLEERHGRC